MPRSRRCCRADRPRSARFVRSSGWSAPRSTTKRCGGACSSGPARCCPPKGRRAQPAQPGPGLRHLDHRGLLAVRRQDRADHRPVRRRLPGAGPAAVRGAARRGQPGRHRPARAGLPAHRAQRPAPVRDDVHRPDAAARGGRGAHRRRHRARPAARVRRAGRAGQGVAPGHRPGHRLAHPVGRDARLGLPPAARLPPARRGTRPSRTPCAPSSTPGARPPPSLGAGIRRRRTGGRRRRRGRGRCRRSR